MGVVKRVKMAVEDYLKLPKNNRVDPDTGEFVAARDEYGRELPDPVPLAPPVGWFKQPSMFDHVRDLVRSEHMRMYAEAQGAETFEEASDFNVDDEMFPSSEYEDASDFEPVVDLEARRQEEFRRRWFAERDAEDYASWRTAERQRLGLPSDVVPTGAQAKPGKSAGGQDQSPPADE